MRLQLKCLPLIYRFQSRKWIPRRLIKTVLCNLSMEEWSPVILINLKNNRSFAYYSFIKHITYTYMYATTDPKIKTWELVSFGTWWNMILGFSIWYWTRWCYSYSVNGIIFTQPGLICTKKKQKHASVITKCCQTYGHVR